MASLGHNDLAVYCDQAQVANNNKEALDNSWKCISLNYWFNNLIQISLKFVS